MGLIQKKEQHEEVDGIQIIEREDTPGDVETSDVELVSGTSAEHIAAHTTAEEEHARAEKEMLENAADKELMPETESDEDDQSSESDGGNSGNGCRKKPMALVIAVAVVAVVVAAVAGYFIGSGGFAGKGIGSANVTEDQLDSTVASYTYNGKTIDVTAREAITSQYSLDTVKNDDDTYPSPSADVILSYVRNQVLLDEAETRGITVSDDEMEEYAESAIGSSDYSTIASQYGLDEDQAKTIVKQQTTLQKLYKQIVGETSTSAPTAPTEPEDGNQSTASKEYADYIINLAGDEWDSEKGTWASEDGTYATALSGEEFTADSATYAQALTAYYTAYQQYSSELSSQSTKWSEFENDLFKAANVTMYGLFV